jgi:hypothetical protein
VKPWLDGVQATSHEVIRTHGAVDPPSLHAAVDLAWGITGWMLVGGVIEMHGKDAKSRSVLDGIAAETLRSVGVLRIDLDSRAKEVLREGRLRDRHLMDLIDRKIRLQFGPRSAIESVYGVTASRILVLHLLAFSEPSGWALALAAGPWQAIEHTAMRLDLTDQAAKLRAAAKSLVDAEQNHEGKGIEAGLRDMNDACNAILAKSASSGT